MASPPSSDIRLPPRPTEFAALIDGEEIAAGSRATIPRNNPAHNVPVSHHSVGGVTPLRRLSSSLVPVGGFS